MPRVNIMNFDDDDNKKKTYQDDNDMLIDKDDIILEKRPRNPKSKTQSPETRRKAPNRQDQPQRHRQSRPTGGGGNTPKPPKENSMFKKFIKSFLITLAVCFLFLGASVFAYNKIFPNTVLSEFDNDNSKYVDTTSNTKLKEQYNFAVFGVDNESPVDPRTDFMMIGSYNTKTNKLSFMSVPRDTKAIMPQERIDFLRAHDVPIIFPESGKMKLNEVNHFATDEYGTSFLLAQLEEMFEVDFDFYLKFNVEAFRYVVDAIGGVPFDVPQRMYYNDPTQDLYIDLQPGYQVLNGEQAEGVVRYRKADEQNPISKGYARGDLDREEVQHDFIEAFINQLSSVSNLGKTLPAIISATSKYCETNFKVTDLPSFLPFITDFNTENITFYTMPNEPSGNFVVPVYPDTTEMIDEIFYSNELVAPAVSSKGLNIEVLNGTRTPKLASKTAEKLEAGGFVISNIGDSTEKQEQTKIYVKERGYGQDLQSYFTNAKIVTDPGQDVDIKIVVGEDEVNASN